jgi:hypothetical protein
VMQLKKIQISCVGLLDLPPSGPKYEASYLN